MMSLLRHLHRNYLRIGQWKGSPIRIIRRSNSQKYSNTNSAMQWSHHHYKDSPEIDRIASSPPPWNMHSNKTSLTQYIALVAAYATTEQHHQSPWCRCSDVAHHLFCRWQLCVENRHPLEVHQLLFLTWNICQRVVRLTYYTMFIVGDAAVEMAQRNKRESQRPNKQKTSFNDHGSKQNRCLQKEYKKHEAMEKV